MSGKPKVKQLCPSCGKSYAFMPRHKKSKAHQRKAAQQAMPWAAQ